VADDDPGSREILSHMLAAWSIQVAVAGSGAEAVAAVRDAALAGIAYDLVLMDWHMDGMDGIEAARLIAHDGTMTSLPVIFMVTAHARAEIMARAASAGIEAFLVKPVESSMLLDSIGAVFGWPAVRHRRGETMPAAVTALALAGRHVLLAEDSEINQQIAVEILAEYGVSVEIAENGAIAVAKVLEHPERFDAVLMDVQMPEMDGIAATEKIREHVGADRLPIIAMTAHAMERERRRCLDSGMNDHVTKPVDPAKLIGALARWIRPRGAALTQRDQALAPAASPPPDTMGQRPAALLDIATALGRVNGNRPLLYRLATAFHDKFAGSGSELRRLIAGGEPRQAELLSHSLAGVAGQLGAMELSQIARALELALGEGRPDEVPELLDMLVPTLTATMAAVGDFASLDAVGTATAPVRPAVATLLAELRQLLAQNNLRARPVFAELRAGLAGGDSGQLAARLGDQLDRLDFGGAGETLVALEAALGPAGSSELG